MWREAERSYVDWSLLCIKQPLGQAVHEVTHVPDGYIRCQVDATLLFEEGKVGFGAVVLSKHGDFISMTNGPILYELDLYQAEAMACHEALSWFKSLNFTKI